MTASSGATALAAEELSGAESAGVSASAGATALVAEESSGADVAGVGFDPASPISASSSSILICSAVEATGSTAAGIPVDEDPGRAKVDPIMLSSGRARVCITSVAEPA